MVRIIVIGTAFLSVFFFPYAITSILSGIASLYFPPTAILVGVLTDLLYYMPPGIPSASLAGIALSGTAFLVRRFIKARIIGG